jgi:hypothetical protein
MRGGHGRELLDMGCLISVYKPPIGRQEHRCPPGHHCSSVVELLLTGTILVGFFQDSQVNISGA